MENHYVIHTLESFLPSGIQHPYRKKTFQDFESPPAFIIANYFKLQHSEFGIRHSSRCTSPELLTAEEWLNSYSKKALLTLQTMLNRLFSNYYDE